MTDKTYRVCCVRFSRTIMYQTDIAKVVGSLSNSVFERRTSTGSGLFASLGSGSVETLG